MNIGTNPLPSRYSPDAVQITGWYQASVGLPFPSALFSLMHSTHSAPDWPRPVQNQNQVGPLHLRSLSRFQSHRYQWARRAVDAQERRAP